MKIIYHYSSLQAILAKNLPISQQSCAYREISIAPDISSFFSFLLLFHFIRVEYGDGLALNPDGTLLLEFGQAAEERELLDTEDICHFLSADIQMDGSALLFGSHLDEVLRHLLLDGEKGEHAHFP